jgi:DNA-binding MarR family transcriptional regulator
MVERTAAADALTELLLEVFRLNGALLAAGNRISSAFGQTSARWQVLGALRTTAQPVSGIAREMGLARQSVQRTTDLLAQEGLVEYVENPAHRRAKLVQLTEAGRATLAGISGRQIEWTNALAANLAADEAKIRRALELVRAFRVVVERHEGESRTTSDKEE